MFTSTLFVSNIHCPSCISYVRDVLRPVAGIESIDVSLLDHRIEVRHADRETMGKSIAEELLQAAFDVQHVTTVDTQGRKIREYNFEEEGARSRLYKWPWHMSKAERKHIENCDACQEKLARHRRKRPTLSVFRRLKTGSSHRARPDVESASERSVDNIPDESKSAVMDLDPKLGQSHRAGKWTASINIGGMTCASCVNTITHELESMNIVQSVNVDLLSNCSTVVFSGERDDVNEIIDAIKDIGYDADIQEISEISPTNSPEVTAGKPSILGARLSIEGMTCSSCVNTITEGVKSLSFVSSVEVNLIGNSAMVEFTGEENVHEILEKIDDLGYEATLEKLEQLGDRAAKDTPQKRTIQIQVHGMFCEHCPSNILSALDKVFGDSITILRQPSLKDPHLGISYRPSPPQITARRFLQVIEETHESFSATVYRPPSPEQRSQMVRRREQRHLLLRLLFTFIVAIPTFIIGIVFMSLVPHDNRTRKWFERPIWAGNVTREEWALFIITTPVMLFGADVFHTRSFKEIRALWRRKSPTPILRRFYRFGSMNLLISVGTAVAYFSSLAVLILDATSKPNVNGSGADTYFDSVTFLTFFILIGRWLEAYSKAKTSDAVALLTSLRPNEAYLVEEASDEKGLTTSKISTDLLEIGDIVSVPHGSSPPTDGVISQEGTFLFDESSLTGESKPVKKSLGDQVFTGSVNVSQPVRIKVTEIGGVSMLDKIVDVVRKGQSKRAPIERIADILTGYFVPVITLIAIITWIIWLALGESGVLPATWLDVRQGGWPFWSLEFAIAVFVVACPCGIGLAAPTALYVGGGLAAKSGILVQGGGQAFQEASQIDIIVFDKTGTLTEGQMKVTDFEMLDSEPSKEQKLSMAMTITKVMEEASTHPIAKAIVGYCDEQLQALPRAVIDTADIKEIPGKGMTGTFTLRITPDTTDSGGNSNVARYQAAIGNQTLISELGQQAGEDAGQAVFLEPLLAKQQNSGRSVAILSWRQLSPDADAAELTGLRPGCLFAIADPLRSDAASILDTLRRDYGMDVHMCTGDNVNTARAIGSQLGIPPSNIRPGVLPQEKAAYIQELQGESRERKIVAFVGDGTNDAPALVAADVSMALSSGSDVAVGTASFILLNSDLTTILQLVRLAKRVFRRVKMNFAWAGIYNVCLIPIAAGVTYPAGRWRLGPVWGSAAMAASSVSVVMSSLALRWNI